MKILPLLLIVAAVAAVWWFTRKPAVNRNPAGWLDFRPTTPGSLLDAERNDANNYGPG